MASRPRSSEERQISRDKEDKRTFFAKVSGALDPSEKQWGKLWHELGSCRRDQVIAYVAWANGVYPCMATEDRFDDTGKTFLSRIYWIRAINMVLHGYNECGTEAELLAQASGMTEQEWIAAFEMDDLFADLPPMPK